MKTAVRFAVFVPAAVVLVAAYVLLTAVIYGVIIFASIFGYPRSWLRLMDRFDDQVLLRPPHNRQANCGGPGLSKASGAGAA